VHRAVGAVRALRMLDCFDLSPASQRRRVVLGRLPRRLVSP
jgi:hypothetical protein